MHVIASRSPVTLPDFPYPVPNPKDLKVPTILATKSMPPGMKTSVSTGPPWGKDCLFQLSQGGQEITVRYFVEDTTEFVSLFFPGESDGRMLDVTAEVKAQYTGPQAFAQAMLQAKAAVAEEPAPIVAVDAWTNYHTFTVSDGEEITVVFGKDVSGIFFQFNGKEFNEGSSLIIRHTPQDMDVIQTKHTTPEEYAKAFVAFKKKKEPKETKATRTKKGAQPAEASAATPTEAPAAAPVVQEPTPTEPATKPLSPAIMEAFAHMPTAGNPKEFLHLSAAGLYLVVSNWTNLEQIIKSMWRETDELRKLAMQGECTPVMLADAIGAWTAVKILAGCFLRDEGRSEHSIIKQTATMEGCLAMLKALNH